MSESGLARLVHGLRAGGVRIGSAALMDANAALAAVGFARRGDVHDALRASLIRDPADLELFDHVFEACFPRRSWAVPGTEPVLSRAQGVEAAPAARRFAESRMLAGDVPPGQRREEEERQASGTSSALERLSSKDFEQMSVAELNEVRRLLASSVPRAAMRRSRQWTPSVAGPTVDVRRMLRARCPEVPLYRKRRLRPRESVFLVDISGSMTVYSRMFLHFAYALNRRARVEAFTFATRLTRISRELAGADPDIAVQTVTRAVLDWDSGTRIGESIETFNREWGRRVLSRAPRVVLLTDGLERGDVALLDRETARLRRSCHELVWINPLLRSAAYEPLAAGAAVLASHVRCIRPAHSAQSLLDLARYID